MTTLHDLFDVEQFNKQVAEGNIVVRKNATGSLAIANYGPEVQFMRLWTPETRASRGLVYRTDNLEVVARPWPKFFNWDDASQPYPPSGSVIMSEKFDGSMGILYLDHEEDTYKIATRGSFISEQAVKATEMFYAMDPESRMAAVDLADQGFTLVFEILYPENRIVLDYGPTETLVLLDVIDTNTGLPNFDEFDELYWFDKAEKTLLPGFVDTLASDVPKNKEGFVLYWPHYDFRCKVKGADYIQLHSILTEVSTRDIWLYMAVTACRPLESNLKRLAAFLGTDPRDVVAAAAAGDEWLAPLIKDVPDEFYGWINRTIETIDTQVEGDIRQIRKDVDRVSKISDYSEQFQAVKNNIYQSFILRIVRQGEGAENQAIIAAWKNAFPAYKKPFSDGYND